VQALEHLTNALKINGSLFPKIQETRDYHVQILTKVGQCYLEAGNYQDALNLFDKSLALSK
jgi:tetratricopeptide (TPR) repeat protein